MVLLSLSVAGGAQVGAPTAVEAAAQSTTTVKVYWNPSGATSYRVIRDGRVIGESTGSATSFTDSTAQPNTTYRYNVIAVAADGATHTGREYVERTFALLADETHCDVLVVGATTAGVSAAVTAARYGLNVVLIEETRRLGGMPVNGLGATDLRRPEHSSGFFEEFRRKVAALYATGDGLEYEPRVAHQAIKEIVWAEPLVVHREVRPVKVLMDGRRVSAVMAEVVPTGRRVTFRPKVVVDATECGDVAAWAGAPFRVGREGRSKREPHAGHLYYDRAGDRPLPGSTGKGDKRVQAYAYLMTVKDFGPGSDKTIPKPDGYDPHKYEHAVKWDNSWAISSGKLPNGKFEVNQHPHGSDLQGVNYGYPTAGYAERRRIEKLYRDHALGYLYYIQTVEGKKNIGLSEDDYRDNNGWPPLLYIREARRFVADQTLDETDIDHARDTARPNAIGIGDYPMDSHAVEPKTDWTTGDMGEGEFYLPQYTPWHQVPYNIMIPRRVDNVFTPTAVSATHVAYGTVRLEPVRMHFGEAAGIAANTCVRTGILPREVPVRQVQTELLKRDRKNADAPAIQGTGGRGPNDNPAKLYMFTDVKPDQRYLREIEWLGARGYFPCPPQSKRTAAGGMAAEPFRPDDPITVGEALVLWRKLDGRSIGDESWKGAVPKSVSGASPGQTLTRGLAAQLFAGYVGLRATAGVSHYVDLTPGTPEEQAAEALFIVNVNSTLWDDRPHISPDGRFTFSAEKPVTRGQFAQLLYLAAIHLGPLWEDHPLDRR